jgi:hypothetical protein
MLFLLGCERFQCFDVRYRMFYCPLNCAVFPTRNDWQQVAQPLNDQLRSVSRSRPSACQP